MLTCPARDICKSLMPRFTLMEHDFDVTKYWGF
jgi:hypothetical protein